MHEISKVLNITNINSNDVTSSILSYVRDEILSRFEGGYINGKGIVTVTSSEGRYVISPSVELGESKIVVSMTMDDDKDELVKKYKEIENRVVTDDEPSGIWALIGIAVLIFVFFKFNIWWTIGVGVVMFIILSIALNGSEKNKNMEYKNKELNELGNKIDQKDSDSLKALSRLNTILDKVEIKFS